MGDGPATSTTGGGLDAPASGGGPGEGEGGTAQQMGYLLEIDPRNTIRLANVRQVKGGSIIRFIDSVLREGYNQSVAPTVYEPSRATRACDMSEEERALVRFPIRDGAHRICGISRLMADPNHPNFPDTFKMQVRVVRMTDNDLVRRQEAISDNAATDNRITKRTFFDELWSLLGARNVLISDLLSLTARWVAIAATTTFNNKSMPHTQFTDLSIEVFEEFKKLMRKVSGDSDPKPFHPDILVQEVTYVPACKYLKKYMPPELPANAELNFVQRNRSSSELKERTGGSLKSVKWSVLGKILPHHAKLVDDIDVLHAGGNGIVRVENKDTRLWDIMSLLNNIGDPLSELPGAIGVRALQNTFFTNEARSRPFLVVFLFAVIARVIGKRPPKSDARGDLLKPLPEQVQTICYQYQNLAELLLERGNLPHTDEQRLHALEELIWPYIVYRDRELDLYVLPPPPSSVGVAVWATPLAKWTYSTDLQMTSEKHPTRNVTWEELSNHDKAIDTERRKLAQALVSDMEMIPYTTQSFQRFDDAIQTEMEADPVASGINRGRRRSRSSSLGRSAIRVSRHVYRVYMAMEAHEASRILSPLTRSPQARSPSTAGSTAGSTAEAAAGTVVGSREVPSKRRHDDVTPLSIEDVLEEEDDYDDGLKLVKGVPEVDVEERSVHKGTDECMEGHCDAESVEADDIEQAKAAVRMHMTADMRVEMRNQSFEDFARSEESQELNGKVWLVLTDPPYNTQRIDSRRSRARDMSHDVLSEEQMRAAADLFERLLAPGGQCYIFCGVSQIALWQAALNDAGGGGSLVPDTSPEILSIMPTLARTGRGFRYARSNACEFALHAFKKHPRLAGVTPQEADNRYACGIAFGKSEIAWRSANTMPPYSRMFNNYEPPSGKALLKARLSSGAIEILRTSQKGVLTLRDIIQTFAPHVDQLIFDPFAGTMSTVIAAIAERRPVIACERDPTCFNMAVSRVHEYCYYQSATNNMLAIPESQRESLGRHRPGPQAVDVQVEQAVSEFADNSSVGR